MNDHARIWLEPAGAPDRCWCQHNQWGDDGVKFVRADIANARIAELEAEVERTNAGWDHTSKMLGASNARAYEAEKALTEALSRTGAVKASDIISQIALWSDDEGLDLSFGQGEDLARRILSALEPAEPEGKQQEAEALTYGQKLIAEAIEHHFGERNEHYDEDVDDTTVHDAWEAFDALTRPSEQAVTGPWRPIKSAPKDASLILYANKFGEIGYCYWSKAGGPFDESMWWDDQADDECCPVVWLPADTLPPLKAALEAGR